MKLTAYLKAALDWERTKAKIDRLFATQSGLLTNWIHDLQADIECGFTRRRDGRPECSGSSHSYRRQQGRQPATQRALGKSLNMIDADRS
jgi:hypothetical protein